MFAVLHIADFSLQAILRIERNLAAKPVALLDPAQRPPVVLACTAEARASGVEPGQTVPQAMARCAAVELRTRQPAAEEEARAGLVAAAFSLSPHVEDTAPGVCTIDVRALPEEKREPALRAAVEQLGKLGLSATAGLAATPLLAWQAARFEERGDSADWNLLAGEASGGGERQQAGAASTRGRSALRIERKIRRIDAGGEKAFLKDLPLAVAEPSAELAAILAGWGVKTLGGLTALAKADVAQRLGPEGLALWERAAGETARPLQRLRPAQTFAAELELENEIETLEPLLFVLRRFIDRLALELRNAGFVAGELALALKLADETVYTRDFRLPEPTAREEILFRVLHTHLETLHTAATVAGVALECRPVRPAVRQQGLFESALRDPHGFAETLARVASVVGAERVGTPVVEDSHRADAVRLVAPAAVVESVEAGVSACRESAIEDRQARRPAVTMGAAPVSGWCGAGQRPALRLGPPLRRLRPAWRATVELNGEAPAFVWAEGARGVVIAAAGPWRGSGEWWERGKLWRREEWDVELEGGGVWRLVHAPEGWFVEGEYD
jgi:protein ImuB